MKVSGRITLHPLTDEEQHDMERDEFDEEIDRAARDAAIREITGS